MNIPHGKERIVYLIGLRNWYTDGIRWCIMKSWYMNSCINAPCGLNICNEIRLNGGAWSLTGIDHIDHMEFNQSLILDEMSFTLIFKLAQSGFKWRIQADEFFCINQHIAWINNNKNRPKSETLEWQHNKSRHKNVNQLPHNVLRYVCATVTTHHSFQTIR